MWNWLRLMLQHSGLNSTLLGKLSSVWGFNFKEHVLQLSSILQRYLACMRSCSTIPNSDSWETLPSLELVTQEIGSFSKK